MEKIFIYRKPVSSTSLWILWYLGIYTWIHDKIFFKKRIKELFPLRKSSLRVNNSSSISHHKNKTNVTGYLIIEWFSFSRPFSKVQLNKQLCKKQQCVGCQTWDNNFRGLAYQEASNTAHEVITTFSHKR